ncbi:Putative protein p14 [Erwinia amylovora Ea644]|uniref:hypothetical protein n=1 Tax=Erwinia amylovora TaxID=552 RepID=UPI0002CC648F|nr:hypothetical protein [Erwinia amylovora]CCP02962.1 Putative protein p14 [Erwinia amylovora Ea644]
MIWLIANWRVLLSMALILLSALMATLASHCHSKYSHIKEEADSAAAITRSATAAINLMYDISKATHTERQALQQTGDKHVVYIREKVKADSCATRAVPAVAADRLRLYADSLRPSAEAKDKR